MHAVSAHAASLQLWKPSRSWLLAPMQLCQHTGWHSGMNVETSPDRAGWPSSAANA